MTPEVRDVAGMHTGNDPKFLVEMLYLKRYEKAKDVKLLRERLDPLFDIFMRQFPKKRREEIMDETLGSIHVVDSNVAHIREYDCPVGLDGKPVVYHSTIDLGEIAEQHIMTPGHLEWLAIMSMGDRYDWLSFKERPVKNHPLAANAILAFYFDEHKGAGVFTENDERSLKIFTSIPVMFQEMRRAKHLGYRIGNKARELEAKGLESGVKNRGLQYIRDSTQ